jgi:hypothetical protein
MLINLEPNRQQIVSAIRSGIANAATPKKPVTRLEFVYDLSSMDVPTIWAQFDFEPNGEPGGSGEKIEIMRMQFPQWAKACQAAVEIGYGMRQAKGEEVIVIFADTSIQANHEETLCAAFGKFLVEIVTSLRGEGAFEVLPRTNCRLAVNTYDGVWAWPVYEDRGKQDLI